MALPIPLRPLARRIRHRFSTYGLSQLSRTILREGLTYLAPAKLIRIEDALKSVSRVEGDFAEFGVALGGSAILIASQRENRQFHGFDVFGMIPEPTSEKDDHKSKSRYETIKSGTSRGIGGESYYGYRDDLFSDVKDSFARHGLTVGKNGIFLHKGLFEDTWSGANVDRLAFAHVDCDWYEPVAYCLKSIAAKLSPGGVIVIDDFHDYGGCRTAVEEFLSLNPPYVFEDGPNPILRRQA
ncbi:TylF/MycF/NovP-related O-methyltransferase [Sphingorhabdus sp. EL138]|jgi:asparagine synthase (glutamine-hydrolysing)|uniref:TylF/MycF/NovP-related O-methyltransferase n=1 Tax=Sphingorhabdus sp. EL138 TaxID=2073156 RepID=UPI000D69C7A6|nr:TylF/MycF/NovP-related O-methyltransferase [Sphingorhabdus sp. EL138]